MKQETTILIPMMYTIGSLVVFLGIGGMVRFPGRIMTSDSSSLSVSMEYQYFDRISKALHAYRNDHGVFPPHSVDRRGQPRLPAVLTSPVAYLASLPRDPWQGTHTRHPYPVYLRWDDGWLVATAGPDHVLDLPVEKWAASTAPPGEAELDLYKCANARNGDPLPNRDLIHFRETALHP